MTLTMSGVSEDEARDFATAFRSFLEWVHTSETSHSEVAELVTGFLGPEVSGRSVVSRSLRPFEHVNLQTAVDAWSAEPGRSVEVRGLSIPPHHVGANLQQIVNAEGIGHLRLSAPQLVDLPNGPKSTLACLQLALLLVEDSLGRYVVLISGPTEQHGPRIEVEVAGLAVDAAQSVHGRLDELRSELNVYRGQIIDVSMSPNGALVLTFGDLPSTDRQDVVLPDDVLARVERHALGVAAHREALLQAGQHLKRGLLLFGPPGTGKTHTRRDIWLDRWPGIRG